MDCPKNTSINHNTSEMDRFSNGESFKKIPSIQLPDELFEKV